MPVPRVQREENVLPQRRGGRKGALRNGWLGGREEGFQRGGAETRREECYGLKKGVYKAAGRTGAEIASGK